MEKIKKPQIQLSIPSDPRYLKIIRSVLQTVGEIYHFSEKDVQAIELATNEACANIINHAYGGKPDFEIHIRLLGYPEKLQIELTDEGKKVNPKKIKSRKLDDIRPGGLGVHLIHSLMDEVYFDQEFQNGNRLILIKERSDYGSDIRYND